MGIFIRVDGGEPIDFADFIILNDLEVLEAIEIGNALALEGKYEGGGGALASFVVTLA